MRMDRTDVNCIMLRSKLRSSSNCLSHFFAFGDSFPSVSFQLHFIRKDSSMSEYGGAFDVTVSNYIRILMAASLQNLAEIMEKTSSLSVAFDFSTHHVRYYLYVRVRVFYKFLLWNFHLISLPMFDRQTEEMIADLLLKFFNSLYVYCKYSIVGLSTDGDRSMAGRIREVAKKIDRMFLQGTVLVWIGLYQLDLVMQVFFVAAFN